MSRRESEYQARLIRLLQRIFPDAVVLKMDPGYKQGIPDILILRGRKWAMLEVKRSERAPERPNQRHYQQVFDNMSFCAFIYPENEEEVIRELQRALRPTKRPRIPHTELSRLD